MRNIQPITLYLNPINENERFLLITDFIVPDVRPYYLISDFGNVYSMNSNRMMKLTKSFDGYNICTLRTKQNKGITAYIHRLEMMTFKYEPGCELLAVDHIDCNKQNNYITNLEWVTLQENTRRAAANGLLLTGEKAPWTKVKDSDVHEICKLYVNGYGLSEISRIMKCGIDSVFRIVHGISRVDISCNYDMGCRYRGYLTEGQIHKICKIYSDLVGFQYSIIKKTILDALNIPNTKGIDNILRCLYRHDIYIVIIAYHLNTNIRMVVQRLV